jgi:hypothetical protein
MTGSNWKFGVGLSGACLVVSGVGDAPYYFEMAENLGRMMIGVSLWELYIGPHVWKTKAV